MFDFNDDGQFGLDDIVQADIMFGLNEDGICPFCGKYFENTNLKYCPYCNNKLQNQLDFQLLSSDEYDNLKGGRNGRF